MKKTKSNARTRTKRESLVRCRFSTVKAGDQEVAFMLDKWESLKNPSSLFTYNFILKLTWYFTCLFASLFLSGSQHDENQHICYLIKLMLTVLHVALMLKNLINSLGIKHTVFFPHVPRTDSIFIYIIHYSLTWDFIQIRYNRNLSSVRALGDSFS